MRARLLDATIDCLIDLGYSATTTTVIADRAGVSRGAQLHHFPTKAELVSAAVEHLANRLGHDLKRDASLRSRAQPHVDDLIDALWARFESPFFAAWLELSMAARTDEDLRVALTPVEQRLRIAMNDWVTGLGTNASKESYHELVELTLYVLQGLALERMVLTESIRRRNEREAAAIASWKRVIAERTNSKR